MTRLWVIDVCSRMTHNYPTNSGHVGGSRRNFRVCHYIYRHIYRIASRYLVHIGNSTGVGWGKKCPAVTTTYIYDVGREEEKKGEDNKWIEKWQLNKAIAKQHPWLVLLSRVFCIISQNIHVGFVFHFPTFVASLSSNHQRAVFIPFTAVNYVFLRC